MFRIIGQGHLGCLGPIGTGDIVLVIDAALRQVESITGGSLSCWWIYLVEPSNQYWPQQSGAYFLNLDALGHWVALSLHCQLIDYRSYYFWSNGMLPPFKAAANCDHFGNSLRETREAFVVLLARLMQQAFTDAHLNMLVAHRTTDQEVRGSKLLLELGIFNFIFQYKITLLTFHKSKRFVISIRTEPRLVNNSLEKLG